MICLKEMECTLGLMGEVIKELGKIIKCMEKVCMYGQMAEDTMANFIWIKNMALVNIISQMELYI